jgi:hypothetical protein
MEWPAANVPVHTDRGPYGIANLDYRETANCEALTVPQAPAQESRSAPVRGLCWAKSARQDRNAESPEGSAIQASY